MANFYCEYCGQKFSSVSSLTAGYCIRHPDGPHKGDTNSMKEARKANTPANTAGNRSTAFHP